MKDLVIQIKAINKAWKLAKKSLGDEHPLATNLRDLKARLQIRLLRTYAPNLVYLIIDNETPTEEPVFSLCLISSVEGYDNVDHLPVRVAKECLSEAEIQRFQTVKH